MKLGFIQFWNRERGYGFVYTSADAPKEEQYFAHIRAFETPIPLGQHPITGSLVSFDAGRTTRGPVAVNIRFVSGGAA